MRGRGRCRIFEGRRLPEEYSTGGRRRQCGHTDECVAKGFNNRLQSVVTAGAAANADANGAKRQRDVVGQDDDALRHDVVFARQRADRFAREIHVRRRFCQDDLLVAHACLAHVDGGEELLLHGHLKFLGECVDGHKPGVVTGLRVLRTRLPSPITR